nr:movement protein [Grapevine Pinot gris virus]
MALMKRIARVSGRIATGATPIAELPSSFIYNDTKSLKGSAGILLERNEIVYQVEPSSISENFRVTTIPIVPMEQLKLLNGSNMNYIHFGALSISIDPLFRRDSGVKGVAFVYDSRWDNASQALLQAFHFDLNNGTASMVCSPNYSVQLSDPRLSTCLSTVLLFENLNFKSGSYAISVRIGVMYRPFNSNIGRSLMSDQTNYKIDGKDVNDLDLKEFGLQPGDNIDRYFSLVPSDSSSIVKSFVDSYKRKGLFSLKSDVRLHRNDVGPLSFKGNSLFFQESTSNKEIAPVRTENESCLNVFSKGSGDPMVKMVKSKSGCAENSAEFERYLKQDYNFGRYVDSSGVEINSQERADREAERGESSTSRVDRRQQRSGP